MVPIIFCRMSNNFKFSYLAKKFSKKLMLKSKAWFFGEKNPLKHSFFIVITLFDVIKFPNDPCFSEDIQRVSFFSESIIKPNYTANVLPMKSTDFFCVQNPVLVYLYFFKRIYCRFHLEKFRIFRVIFS